MGASETHIKNVIFIKLVTICCDYIAIQHDKGVDGIHPWQSFTADDFFWLVRSLSLSLRPSFPIFVHLVLYASLPIFSALHCDFSKGRFEDNFSSKHDNSDNGNSDDGGGCVLLLRHMCHAKYMQKHLQFQSLMTCVSNSYAMTLK